MFKALKVWKHYQISTLSNKQPVKKYKDSVLTQKESQELAAQLQRIMQNEKPYLDDSISLSSLASALDIQPRQLSQVINENYERNFFDFINSFRIEEAKTMLSDVKFKGHKIYEIMYDVGFNSRSSFNTAFKKVTGRTAKQYREHCLQKV